MEDKLFEGKTEDELWILFKKNKDARIRDFFVKQYAPLVKYVAGKVAIGMPHTVAFADLGGVGGFGLFAIFDELRSIDWVPRSVRQKTREIEEAIHRLEAGLGRAATDQEISDELGISIDDFHKNILKISGTSILSLNDVWFTGEENDKVSIVDSIESPQSLNPETIVEKEEIRRVIVDAIHELPEKEKQVLVLYYYEDLTLKEIGKVLEVTESRVSQLHTKAIMRLRAKLTSIKKGIM